MNAGSTTKEISPIPKTADKPFHLDIRTVNEQQCVRMIEEAAEFFKDEGVQTFIQFGFQNERSSPICSMSILKISAPASFDRSYLLLHDPAYIVDIDPSPENFCVFLDYLPENDGLWFYACNFDSSEWSEICLPSSCVRRRKVSRLLISIDDVERASFLKDSWLSRYRSIHPKFIDAALTGFEYKIEIVVEYQRFLRDRYDSCNLGYSDPAPWNFALSSSSTSDIGWGENCLADPTSCPLSSLRPLDQCSTFRLIDGWQILHDFVHILHPNRDEMGWQYSDSFANDCERTDQSATSWSRDRGTKPFPVRRRLWMRTLVKEIDLEDCRTALDTYISTHPRGVIFSSIVQRRSHYRKRWCDAIATLKDDKIEFQIKNNYQKFVSYQLHGCEPVLLSHTSEASDYLTKFSLFGLRKIGGALLPGLPVENHLDNSGGIICVLNAHSLELRDNWISVLTHQLLLVNSYRFLKHDCPQFSPPIGPPCLLDTPIILGKLWKKGKFVWKLRTFELRKSGVLAYFKRGRLIGEVRLLNEYLINVPSDTSFQYPFEIITSDGKVILELAATNDECRLRWITTIQRIIAAAWERRNSLSAAFSEESTFTELTSQMIPHILSQSFKTDIAHIQETEVDDAHRFEVTGFTASPSEHYSYWLGNYDEDDDEDDEGEEL